MLSSKHKKKMCIHSFFLDVRLAGESTFSKKNILLVVKSKSKEVITRPFQVVRENKTPHHTSSVFHLAPEVTRAKKNLEAPLGSGLWTRQPQPDGLVRLLPWHPGPASWHLAAPPAPTQTQPGATIEEADRANPAPFWRGPARARTLHQLVHAHGHAYDPGLEPTTSPAREPGRARTATSPHCANLPERPPPPPFYACI